jgi:hypothetical protein
MKMISLIFLCIDGEQSNSTISLHDADQHHHPIATTSGSVRSTTSSSSSVQQPTNFYEHGNRNIQLEFVMICDYVGSIDIHHHTPNRSSLINISHGDYSPSIGTFVHSPTTVFQSSSSPKQNPNHFSGQYRKEIYLEKIFKFPF